MSFLYYGEKVLNLITGYSEEMEACNCQDENERNTLRKKEIQRKSKNYKISNLRKRNKKKSNVKKYNKRQSRSRSVKSISSTRSRRSNKVTHSKAACKKFKRTNKNKKPVSKKCIIKKSAIRKVICKQRKLSKTSCIKANNPKRKAHSKSRGGKCAKINPSPSNEDTTKIMINDVVRDDTINWDSNVQKDISSKCKPASYVMQESSSECSISDSNCQTDDESNAPPEYIRDILNQLKSIKDRKWNPKKLDKSFIMPRIADIPVSKCSVQDIFKNYKPFTAVSDKCKDLSPKVSNVSTEYKDAIDCNDIIEDNKSKEILTNKSIDSCLKDEDLDYLDDYYY